MRSSKANVTEGRKSIKAKVTKKLPESIPDPQDSEISEIGEYAPFENNDILRRDGLRIKRHDWDPSDGQDIIECKIPGLIESVTSIKRMIDNLRVVWTPGPKGGYARIEEWECDAEAVDDERLGYALCKIDGQTMLRVWGTAKYALSGKPRFNKDGSAIVRAEYIEITDTMVCDIRDCLQRICGRWMPAIYDEGRCPRIPKFEESGLRSVLNNVAQTNGTVNPALEIAETTDWDGTPRMMNFFKDLGYTVPESCGLTAQETDYWLECVARWTFLGLMERQIRPTVYDLYLILWGDQGTGKTTTAQYIANGFFGRAPEIPREKNETTLREFLRGIAGKLVYSMEEGGQFTNGNVPFLKDLASMVGYEKVEKYRIEIEKLLINCIFVITTNNHQIIKDPDGQTRRYAPITAGINKDGRTPFQQIEYLEREHPEYMDQIFAEALFIVREKLAEDDKQRVWSSGEKMPDGSIKWAFDETMYGEGGIQSRVCRQCLEKDARVEDLADYVKARLTGEIIGGNAEVHTVGRTATVEATEIENDYFMTAKPGQVSKDWPKITRTLRKNSRLYGLAYDRYTVGGKSIRGFRLIPQGDPADPRRSPPSSKETGQGPGRPSEEAET